MTDVVEEVITTTPKFKIGSIVTSRTSNEIAMVRSYESHDDGWKYKLSHSINGETEVDEVYLELQTLNDHLLLRYTELFLLKAQDLYRRVMQDKELELSVTLNQNSDTHDTVITHRIVAGSHYGTNNVRMEGADLIEISDLARWEMSKRAELAPKRLTRYRD